MGRVHKGEETIPRGVLHRSSHRDQFACLYTKTFLFYQSEYVTFYNIGSVEASSDPDSLSSTGTNIYLS